MATTETNATVFTTLETSKNGLQDAPTWFELTDGTQLYLPREYDTRIDLENNRYISRDNQEGLSEEFLNQYPTLQDLVAQGKGDFKFPFKSVDYFRRDISSRDAEGAQDVNLEEIQKYFKDKGYNVSLDAIRYCYECWLSDFKSGYRDEENGVHLFSPCGCNPLHFSLTTLHHTASYWQKTYWA